jgi:hypothetical protein
VGAALWWPMPTRHRLVPRQCGVVMTAVARRCGSLSSKAAGEEEKEEKEEEGGRGGRTQ